MKRYALLPLLLFSSMNINSMNQQYPEWQNMTQDEREELEARDRLYLDADWETAGKAKIEAEEHKRKLGLKLLEAAYENNLEKAKRALEAGANVNFQRYKLFFEKVSSTSPFLYAIKNGMLEFCELLIEHGVDINATQKNGDSPLFFASDEVIAEFLLAHGADIKHTTKNNSTVLQAAAIQNEALCEFYIKAGADIRCINIHGIGVLTSAALRRRLPLCELFVEKMLTIPHEENKPRMYTLLWCLKERANEQPLIYNKNIRQYIVRMAIREENIPGILAQLNFKKEDPSTNDILEPTKQHLIQKYHL